MNKGCFSIHMKGVNIKMITPTNIVYSKAYMGIAHQRNMLEKIEATHYNELASILV